MSARVLPEEVAGVLKRARDAGLFTEEMRSAVFLDLGRLRERTVELEESFPAGTLHAVAIKANPIIEVLRVLVQAGMGLEAASWEEVCCGLAAGCPPERLVFDSPAKTLEELRLAVEAGVLVNVDSEREVERLEQLGVPEGMKIGIRVNPCVGEGSIASTSTVGRNSKFGVDLDVARSIVSRVDFINGLHVHTGSQGVGLQLIERAIEATAELADALDLEWLDVGGGIPVRYTDKDPEPPTMAAWGAAVKRAMGKGSKRLVTEPGRSILAPVGWAITRIENVKPGVEPTLVVHLGADFLLRRVYRPDDWDYEFIVLDPSGEIKGGPLQPTRIAGPLCFSGDVLANARMLPVAEEGDLLLIRDCGAYTTSMWSRHCSRGLPPTIGYDQKGIRTLHAGEKSADVVEFWSMR